MMQLDMSIAIILTIGVLIVLVCGLSGWLFVIDHRIKKFLAGKKARSLEEIIGTLGANVHALEKFRDQTALTLAHHESRLRRSIQGVETIRFNAFTFKGHEGGGNQSFAIALLSEDGNGTVLSSLYTRDHISVFAKPIKKFVSEYEMTKEERDVVARATPR
jgi:hypothetical protein